MKIDNNRVHERLLNVLEMDSKFLRDNNIMDYSFYIAIEKVPKTFKLTKSRNIIMSPNG